MIHNTSEILNVIEYGKVLPKLQKKNKNTLKMNEAQMGFLLMNYAGIPSYLGDL